MIPDEKAILASRIAYWRFFTIMFTWGYYQKYKDDAIAMIEAFTTYNIGAAQESELSALRETLAHDNATLNECYEALFISPFSENLNPYASFYENGFERSAVLIDVRERMKNAHVVKDTNALIEDEDHVGFLAGLMADWLQQYDVTNDAMWLHRANQLFEEIISPFIDTFSTELAHRSSHESYNTVAKLLAGFTAIERLWLELPTPSQKEYPRYVNPLQGVYKKKKKRELYAEEEATLSQSKKNTNQ